MDEWAVYCEWVYYWIEEFRKECENIGFDHSNLSDYTIENEIMGSINNKPKDKAEEMKNKQDRTCSNNCSVVCGECQLPPTPLQISEIIRSFEDENAERREYMFQLMDLYTDDVMGGCNLSAKEWYHKIYLQN